MVSIAIFAISGTALVTLVTAKRIGEKRRKPLFISNWIMKSDSHIREWHHRALKLYSEGKDRASFFATKQMPMHSKNFFNKFSAFLKEKMEQYENSIRDSRLIKKPAGISEFFKSISEVEKGNGTIDESLENSSQEREKEVK